MHLAGACWAAEIQSSGFSLHVFKSVAAVWSATFFTAKGSRIEVGVRGRGTGDSMYRGSGKVGSMWPSKENIKAHWQPLPLKSRPPGSYCFKLKEGGYPEPLAKGSTELL